MHVINLDQQDAVWSDLRKEADTMAVSEPMLASYLHATVLNTGSLSIPSRTS